MTLTSKDSISDRLVILITNTYHEDMEKGLLSSGCATALISDSLGEGNSEWCRAVCVCFFGNFTERVPLMRQLEHQASTFVTISYMYPL